MNTKITRLPIKASLDEEKNGHLLMASLYLWFQLLVHIIRHLQHARGLVGEILMNLFKSLTSMDKQMVWGGDSIFSPS